MQISVFNYTKLTNELTICCKSQPQTILALPRPKTATKWEFETIEADSVGAPAVPENASEKPNRVLNGLWGAAREPPCEPRHLLGPGLILEFIFEENVSTSCCFTQFEGGWRSEPDPAHEADPLDTAKASTASSSSPTFAAPAARTFEG